MFSIKLNRDLCQTGLQISRRPQYFLASRLVRIVSDDDDDDDEENGAYDSCDLLRQVVDVYLV